MACRYFSCSRLLDESESKGRNTENNNHHFKISLNYSVFFIEASGINSINSRDKLQFHKKKSKLAVLV